MVKVIRVVDVSNMPDVVDLVEHVEDTGGTIVLKLRGRVVAVLESADETDPRIRRRALTPEDIAAFRRSAGSWPAESAEIVLRNLAERRGEPWPPENGA